MRIAVYSLGQASKAVLPKDAGGPWGKRIGVSVGGTLNWVSHRFRTTLDVRLIVSVVGVQALVVGAYVTGRVNPSDWLRYSIVVLNW
jgi:hypothetical protein